MYYGKDYKISISDQYSEWVSYLGKDVGIGKAFRSPLRNDKKPSCSLFISADNDVLMRDFGTGKTYNIETFLKTIGKDNVTKTEVKINTIELKQIEKHKKIKTIIQIKGKEWDKEELDYWKQYHISLETLKLYKVKPISHYWITNRHNKHHVRCQTITFSYEFGNGNRKIYAPESAFGKWSSNLNYNFVFGQSQLDKTGKLLIITKSLKDIMVYKEVFGINSIAFQSESYMPSEEQISSLKERFNKIIINYDNDATGIAYAEKISKVYNFECLFMDGVHKDVSDSIKNNFSHCYEFIKKYVKCNKS